MEELYEFDEASLNEENKTAAEGGICAAGEAAAKRKGYDWPSAYASGAVVRCRQGKIWKGEK